MEDSGDEQQTGVPMPPLEEAAVQGVQAETTNPGETTLPEPVVEEGEASVLAEVAEQSGSEESSEESPAGPVVKTPSAKALGKRVLSVPETAISQHLGPRQLSSEFVEEEEGASENEGALEEVEEVEEEEDEESLVIQQAYRVVNDPKKAKKSTNYAESFGSFPRS